MKVYLIWFFFIIDNIVENIRLLVVLLLSYIVGNLFKLFFELRNGIIYLYIVVFINYLIMKIYLEGNIK